MNEKNYCEWYARPLRDVTEWQQEQCKESGMCCIECEFLKEREIKEDE